MAGAMAWAIWGLERCDGLPAVVGEALAQVLGHATMPWRPAGRALGWALGEMRRGLGFGRLGGGLAPCGLVESHPVLEYPQLFVDAAWDQLQGVPGFRVGIFSPSLGTRVEWLGERFSLGTRRRPLNQKAAELWGVWSAVRLACHMGWGGVALFLDNAGAIYQGVRGRASVGLWIQQWLLRRINLLLFGHPLVVHFVFVPSPLQPADPVSRLEGVCGGSRAAALERARDIWGRLGGDLSYALYIGSVARYIRRDWVPVTPLLLPEGGGQGLMGRRWLVGFVKVVGGFMRFVSSKGVWVWVPEEPPEPCFRCVAAQVPQGRAMHWFADCPRRRVGFP